MATSRKKIIAARLRALKAAARVLALKKEPLLALSALLGANADLVALKSNPPPPPPPPWRPVFVLPTTKGDHRILMNALRKLGYSRIR